MKRVYSEIGFGNKTFLSTEFEENNTEYRRSGFIRPEKIDDYYFRVWIFKKVFIFSTKDGFKFILKSKRKLKLLFGISGIIN